MPEETKKAPDRVTASLDRKWLAKALREAEHYGHTTVHYLFSVEKARELVGAVEKAPR